MSCHPSILRPITLNVVVQPGQMLPEHSRQMQLYGDREVVDVWYWGDLPTAIPSRLRKAVAYLVPVNDAEEDDTHYVVTRFDWRDSMEAFALAPISLGNDPEDVYRGRDLMQCVQHPAVRELLSDVFTEPSVFYDYWTAPNRPLAEPGSLVRNAVALGEHFRDRAFLPRDHRDLGIAYAVLRDIGNVWFHSAEDSARARADAVRIALHKLDGPLAHFEAVCPEYSVILRELLLASTRAPKNPRSQVLLHYASEVPEHHGPLVPVDFPR